MSKFLTVPFLILTTFMKTSSAEVVMTPLNVLIFAGQSNACGPAESPGTNIVDRDILYYYKIFRTSVASDDPNDETNWWKPAGLTTLAARPGKHGAEFQLARSFLQSQSHTKLMVVKVCAGSSSLFKHWLQGDFFMLSKHLLPTVRTALAGARARGYAPQIRGFVWIQGESDVHAMDIHGHHLSEYYAGGLDYLVKYLQQALATSFPVLIARIRGPEAVLVTETFLAKLRTEQADFSACNAWARTVPIDQDVEGRFDGTIHWHAEAHRRVGLRLAYHLQRLIERGPIATPTCNQSLRAEWLNYYRNHR